MSVALYVALEKEIPEFDASSVCGKLLAKAQKKLDGIAQRIGLRPLEDFISTDPEEIRGLLEDVDGVPDGLEIPAEQWFKASDGLKTVRGLLEHLRDDPAGIRDVRGVINDLEATEQVLAVAAKKRIRFHLAVDFRKKTPPMPMILAISLSSFLRNRPPGETDSLSPGGRFLRKEDNEMARIIGIGGVFFRSANPATLYAWYEKHLGLKRTHGVVIFPWKQPDDATDRMTVWSLKKDDTDYFGPANPAFMLNYIVDDLDGMVADLKAAGAQVEDKQDSEYGRFAWVTDPEGNRIELWQPPNVEQEVSP